MRAALHNIMLMSCVILTLALTSCVHKELCYDHPHTLEVDVVFDWSQETDADPETMSLYLFPQDDGKVERYEFTDRNGGRIRVAEGEYKAICLNSDTRSLHLEEKDKYETFRITSVNAELHARTLLTEKCADSPPRAKGTEDERVAASPDKVWTGNLDELIVNEATESIIMTPKKSYIRFKIEVHNVENLEYAFIVSGALTTLSESVLPGLATLSEENVTIPFGAGFSTTERSIWGEFQTFGHCPYREFQHFLILYITMSDGSNISYRYDVTEQIHTAPDPENIVIILDGLTLPEPEDVGGGVSGGMKPVVGEWTTIDIGLKM